MQLRHPLSVQKKQKKFYSGKKKRHSLKSQVIVDKKSRKIISTTFSNGRKHDFKLFKESKYHIHKNTKILTDTGYQGIKKLHVRAELPKKKSKKYPLSKADKQSNQKLASERVLNENVIGFIKRFKIIADRYRNRRRKFQLRFNLISAIHNMEIAL